MEVPAALVWVLLFPYGVVLACLTMWLIRTACTWRSNAKALVRCKAAGVLDGDFVVFIIGATFNYDFLLHALRDPRPHLHVLMAMGRILQELQQHPEYGCLAVQHTDFKTHLVQIWRSYDDLLAYARGAMKRHLPAWQRYYKDGTPFPDGILPGIGIWHETYCIKAGNYETVYVNMAPHGLAKARGARLIPATTGKMSTSMGRMGMGRGDDHQQLQEEASGGDKVRVEGPSAGAAAAAGAAGVPEEGGGSSASKCPFSGVFGSAAGYPGSRMHSSRKVE